MIGCATFLSDAVKADIKSSEITDERTYLNRRAFMRAGVLAASVVATGAVYRRLNRVGSGGAQPAKLALIPTTAPTTTQSAGGIDISKALAIDEPRTSYEAITHYNNFYEVSTDKEEVARVAANFNPKPWTVSVEGL